MGRSIILVVVSLAVAGSFASLAEEVEVKGRGTVDLEDFVCAVPRKQSMLNRFCYDEVARFLIVEINSNWYQHCGVSQKALYGLILTETVSSYYNTRIRPLKCRGSE